MRILAFAVLLLVAGAQANFLDDLKGVFSNVGDAFKATGKDLLNQLDHTASSLLHTVTDQATTLLSEGAQALVLNTINNVQSATNHQSTRSISDFLGKVNNFKDEAVHMLQVGEQQLQTVLSTLLKSFNNILEKIKNFELTPQTVVAAIDKLTGAHSQLLDLFMKDLVSSADSLVSKHFGTQKRSSVGDFFNNLGSSLASAFKPVVDTVQSMVNSTGTALKNSATSFLSAAKDSASQLGQKLQPHLQTLQGHAQTLLQHGTNALSALKAATADIMQQTMQNMQGTVNQMGQTVVAAGQTAVQHVANQVGGAATATNPQTSQ